MNLSFLISRFYVVAPCVIPTHSGALMMMLADPIILGPHKYNII